MAGVGLSQLGGFSEQERQQHNVERPQAPLPIKISQKTRLSHWNKGNASGACLDHFRFWGVQFQDSDEAQELSEWGGRERGSGRMPRGPWAFPSHLPVDRQGRTVLHVSAHLKCKTNSCAGGPFDEILGLQWVDV